MIFSYIYNADIIHSDLKPANFLLVAGALKLIDFGIANAVPSHKTSVTKDYQMGTPNYMSPEALKGIEDGDENEEVKFKVSFIKKFVLLILVKLRRKVVAIISDLSHCSCVFVR